MAQSATPILDSGILPPRRRKNSVLGICFGLLIGVAFGALIAKVSSTQSQSNFAVLTYFIVLVLAVVIHELGHLAAGYLVGFHFASLSLGPFVLGKEHGRMKIRFRQGLGALGFAGVNIDHVRRLRHRFLVFVTGGPSSNLLSAVVALLFIKYAAPSVRESWLMPVMAGFVYISLILGVIGFLPLVPKSRSDGTRMWVLLTSKEKSRRLISAMALINQTRLGIQIKYWKRTWLKAVTSVRDGSFDEFTANWIAFFAASSRKDVPTLTAHLERCLELAYMLPVAKRDEIAREAGIYAAWFRDDTETAEKWFAQIKYPRQVANIVQTRVNIALASAQKDFDGAFKGIEQGSTFLESMPETPVKAVLKQSWQEWAEEIKEKQNQNQTTSV